MNTNTARRRTKKRTVEACRRISAREARRAGLGITTTPMPQPYAARHAPASARAWCLCPQCGARCGFLYQRPEGDARSDGSAQDATAHSDGTARNAWACRRCHSLTYRSAQMKGTRAAFYAWLSPDQWRAECECRPHNERLYSDAWKAWCELCAPFDLQNMTAEQRLTALQTYGSAEVVNALFRAKLGEWEEVRRRLEQEAARRTMADVWAEWKAQHRTPRRKSIFERPEKLKTCSSL